MSWSDINGHQEDMKKMATKTKGEDNVRNREENKNRDGK